MRKKAPKKAAAKLLQEKATFSRIVARALKIASEEGLAALTIGRLAKGLKMSKSGVFAHFLSKETLELATIEQAREVFVSHVLPSTELSQAGITKVWSLCDDWLKHIQQEIFPGSYFFNGAFFESAGQSGPIPDRIREITQEWLDGLKRAVKQAQKEGDLDRDVDAERVALALNGLLLGGHWAHLLGDYEALKETRAAVMDKLHGLATDKIPPKAFKSVRTFRDYLEESRP